MKTFVFSETQLNNLVLSISQTLMENASVDISVSEDETNIHETTSKISFDDAVAIESQVGVFGICYVLPHDVSVDYKK